VHTRLNLVGTVLCLALAAVAQQTPAKKPDPAVAAPPLPDPVELFRRVHANQKQIEELRKNYICDFNEETQQLAADNSVKKTETKGYEMFFVAGQAIVRMVSKEGSPLDEGEKRKEEEKVEQRIRKAQEGAAKRERNEEDKNTITIEHFLRGSRFQNGRYETFKGRRVLAYDFEPNPDCKPHSRPEVLVSKLGGTVWIDPEALEVVRLQAHLLGSFKVAGGLLGSVREGSALVLEQERVNNELWMPSYVDFSLGARVLLVKSVHERIVDRFSNYRKFRVETTIRTLPPPRD